MKYIIIKEASGAEFPYFCVAPCTHRELWAMVHAAKPGRSLVSAGFYIEMTGGAVRTFGRSDSLDLEPRQNDALLIHAWVSVTRTSALAQFGQTVAA